MAAEILILAISRIVSEYEDLYEYSALWITAPDGQKTPLRLR